MPITDTSKKVRKITVGGEVMPLYNGKYNIEAVLNEDGTQTLNIFDWDYVPSEPILPDFDPVFANNTPAQISAVSAVIEKNGYTSAQVKEIFGWDLQTDTHPITLTNGETIQVRMIGFNHDILSSDHISKAGITLGMVNCLDIFYVMNDTRTNAGGYFGSQFVRQDLPTIYDMLPEEWKSIIKPVDKKAANGGGTNYSEVITQSCNIFLQAEIEIDGIAQNSKEGLKEGNQYEYWVGKTETDRIKKYNPEDNGVRSVIPWIIRSSPINSIADMLTVGRNGVVGTVNANIGRGISFAFCV